MKRTLIILLAPIVLAVLYLGVQSVRLKWWTTAGMARLAELTPSQKAADMQRSGLIFYMGSEPTFNADGTLNNYVGVVPDIVLNPSTYPTPYPPAFDLPSIAADGWVQWVLRDRPQNGFPASS